jgi:hypothetical protein
MQIFIKTNTGKVIMVEVESSTSTFELKLLCQEREGFLPHEIKLDFAAKPLFDERTME